MMKETMVLNSESSQSEEKLRILRKLQQLISHYKSMGIDPDDLGIVPATQVFIDQSFLELDEEKESGHQDSHLELDEDVNKEKESDHQDSLPSKKELDATHRPESSRQGAERNRRMPSSHSSGLHPMVSPETSQLGAKRNKISESSGKKVKINPPLMMPVPVSQNLMPPELMNTITRHGGAKVTWVIRKSLSKTDLSKGHDRISIPRKQVRLFENTLTTQEMHELKNGFAIDVDVLVLVTGDNERPPEVKKLKFSWWNMSKGGIYALRTRWWQLVEYYLLEVGDEVLIWCFRQGNTKKLGFAINVRRRNI